MESEIQRLLHKGKDEGGGTVLEIIDYRLNEELLSQINATGTERLLPRSRDTKYAEVGRWIENNLSETYVQSHQDSLSHQQHESKLWMVEEMQIWCQSLTPQNPHIEVVGSWFGWPLMEYIDYFPQHKTS